MVGHILDMFAIVSSLATAICAVVAYKTLLEIKAQRETIYRPDIIIDEAPFFIYNSKGVNGEYPNEFTYEKKTLPYHLLSKPSFDSLKLRFFNIGFGAAKDISIYYSIDISPIISKINELNKKLPSDKIITVIENKHFINFTPEKKSAGLHSSHSIANQYVAKINHILPVNISNSPYEHLVPTYFWGLFSILVHCFGLSNGSFDLIPEMPSISIRLEYLDIGNKKHSKNIEACFKYYGGTKQESFGSIIVSELKKDAEY